MRTTIRFLALVAPLATCFLPLAVAVASESTLYQEEVVTLKGVKKVVMDIAVAELRIKQHAESELSLRAELRVKEVDVPLLDRKPAELKVSLERDGEVVRLRLSSLQANGDGSHPLAAQIGVGSLSLRLEP